MRTYDWEFKTFNDPALIKLLDFVKSWCERKNSEKSILTISGPTETGKTHLLKKIHNLYSKYISHFPKKKKGAYPDSLYIVWSEFTRKVLSNSDGVDWFDRIKHSGIVLIEDFLSEDMSTVNNYTKIVASNAYDVINSRVGKPTVIDTNRSEEDIEKIDVRIHSRLFREGGVFLSLPKTTKKYLSRK